MADELDPVEQRFIADLSDYVEPIRDDAVPATEEFSAAVDDATGSLEGFTESEHRARDAIAETDHELHDQTESYFALAAAMDAVPDDRFDDRFGNQFRFANDEALGLEQTLLELRSLLGDAEDGDMFGVGRTGSNRFQIVTDQDSAAVRDLTFSEEKFRDAMLEADEVSIRARADMDSYRDSLGGLDRAVKDMITGGEFSRLEGGGGNRGGFLTAIANFFGAEEGSSGILGNIAALGAGLAIVGPLLVGIITEVGTLITGFIAAGAGIGAFALFAIPELKKVEGVLTGTAKASTLKGYTKEAYDDIEKLIGEYKKLAHALAPEELRVFHDALKFAADLLPALAPLAKVAGDAVGTLFQNADKFVQSSGFKDWMKQFDKISPGAITAIGEGIGKVAGAFGKLMTALSGKDIAHGINIFFDGLAGMINFFTRVVKDNAKGWDDWETRVKRVWHGIEDAWHEVDGFVHRVGGDIINWTADIGNGFMDLWRVNDKIRGYMERAWHDITGFVSTAKTHIESFISSLMSRVTADWDTGWSNVVKFAGRIPGDILHALGDLGSLLVRAGEDLIGGLIHGIESALGPLESIVDHVKSLLGFGGGGTGSLPNATSGLAHTVTGALGTPHPSQSSVVQHSVTVNLANVMSAPAQQQALQRHVQAAVLDFAKNNSSSMLVLPGRRP